MKENLSMLNIFIDDCVNDDTISKYDVSYYSLNVYKFDDLEIKFINEFNKHKLTLSQSFKKSIADKLKDI